MCCLPVGCVLYGHHCSSNNTVRQSSAYEFLKMLFSTICGTIFGANGFYGINFKVLEYRNSELEHPFSLCEFSDDILFVPL